MTRKRPAATLFADGFTLVELLVTLSIIVVLAGLLLPAALASRRAARLIACASNVRQLCVTMHVYAAASKGKFPPNVVSPSPGRLWCDQDRVGALIPSAKVDGFGRVGGGVYVCPDDDNAVRSYAMNVWASARVDPYVLTAIPQRGILFSNNVRDGSRMLLVVESWASTSAVGGFAALPTIGFEGETPGQRFGVGGGISPPVFCGPWGTRNSELPFGRHVRSTSGKRYPLNFGHVDGHVATYTLDELADRATGLSRVVCLWSPNDQALNQQP